MTTDSITSAAYTEAAHRDMDPSVAGENNRAWFVAGAKWQAAQEPTDAECTAVLNAVTTPLGEEPKDGEWFPAAIQRCREAMMSARTARWSEGERNG